MPFQRESSAIPTRTQRRSNTPPHGSKRVQRSLNVHPSEFGANPSEPSAAPMRTRTNPTCLNANSNESSTTPMRTRTNPRGRNTPWPRKARRTHPVPRTCFAGGRPPSWAALRRTPTPSRTCSAGHRRTLGHTSRDTNPFPDALGGRPTSSRTRFAVRRPLSERASRCAGARLPPDALRRTLVPGSAKKAPQSPAARDVSRETSLLSTRCRPRLLRGTSPLCRHRHRIRDLAGLS